MEPMQVVWNSYDFVGRLCLLMEECGLEMKQAGVYACKGWSELPETITEMLRFNYVNERKAG